MALQIFQMPEKLGRSLRMFIDRRRYDESFSNMQEMRRWFINREKHLGGHDLRDDPIILDTEIVETFGIDGSHHVLRPVNRTQPLMVVGAASYLHDVLFEELVNALDYAAAEAADYDAI
ncbi:hypothetical protein G6L09_11380 [Agrobacterium rhizogenes]|nr:hypothetical protein [Rhizobium rhizogenes]NTH71156.1 hypothetical protein [Rhizobium rhizogenes]